MKLPNSALALIGPLTTALALLCPLVAAGAAPRDQVDWPAFLARHDLVWEQLPRQWNEGAFAGNGNMGFVAYADLDANGLIFHLGRMDVTDHRQAPDDKTSMGVNGTSVMFDFPRLDIGRMMLRPAGRITGGTMRQDLWNAEVTGTITTDLGELKFRALTLRDNMVTVVEVTSTEDTAEGKPAEAHWEFLPGNPSSPRAITSPDQAQKIGYEPNPPPEIQKLDGVSVCVTSLLAGGDFATAWLEQTVIRRTRVGPLREHRERNSRCGRLGPARGRRGESGGGGTAGPIGRGASPLVARLLPPLLPHRPRRTSRGFLLDPDV